ncbi:unnamed protein product, partial [Ectocarpus sp. 6 AP-2014]
YSITPDYPGPSRTTGTHSVCTAVAMTTKGVVKCEPVGDRPPSK